MFQARKQEKTAVSVYFDTEQHAEAAIDALELRGKLKKLPLSKKACLVVKPNDDDKQHLFCAHVPYEHLQGEPANAEDFLKGCIGAIPYFFG